MEETKFHKSKTDEPLFVQPSLVNLAQRKGQCRAPQTSTINNLDMPGKNTSLFKRNKIISKWLKAQLPLVDSDQNGQIVRSFRDPLLN